MPCKLPASFNSHFSCMFAFQRSLVQLKVARLGVHRINVSFNSTKTALGSSSPSFLVVLLQRVRLRTSMYVSPDEPSQVDIDMC